MAFTTDGQHTGQMQPMGLNVMQSVQPLAPSAPVGDNRQNSYVAVSPQSPSNNINGANISPRASQPSGNMVVNVSVGGRSYSGGSIVGPPGAVITTTQSLSVHDGRQSQITTTHIQAPAGQAGVIQAQISLSQDSQRSQSIPHQYQHHQHGQQQQPVMAQQMIVHQQSGIAEQVATQQPNGTDNMNGNNNIEKNNINNGLNNLQGKTHGIPKLTPPRKKQTTCKVKMIIFISIFTGAITFYGLLANSFRSEYFMVYQLILTIGYFYNVLFNPLFFNKFHMFIYRYNSHVTDKLQKEHDDKAWKDCCKTCGKCWGCCCRTTIKFWLWFLGLILVGLTVRGNVYGGWPSAVLIIAIFNIWISGHLFINYKGCFTCSYFS